jgi:hypothetical protein
MSAEQENEKSSAMPIPPAARSFAAVSRDSSRRPSHPSALSPSRLPSASIEPFLPGDQLYFLGDDEFSRAIAWRTASWSQVFFGLRFSHVGICAEVEYQGKSGVFLFESTTFCDEPCLITGKKIAGVQAHLPQARVDAYPGKVWRLRLTDPLDEEESRGLSKFLSGEIGKPYDARRAALLAGGWFQNWSQLAPTSDAWFCSELAAAALKRVDRVVDRSADPESFSPNSLATASLHSGEVWAVGEKSQSRRLK